MQKPALIIYFFLLSAFVGLGLKGLHLKTPSRSLASGDCNSSVLAILKREIPDEVAMAQADNEITHYRFKNNLWNKIISIKDFENFNEDEYFKYLEIYRDPSAPFWKKNEVHSLTPVTIEQKLALIEAINLHYAYFANMPSIQHDVESLNALKLRKVQKLFAKFELDKTLTRENLEDFSSDFFLILKGPPVSLLNYFTANKTKRMNERMMRVLQEDMLTRGLSGLLERIPEKYPEGKMEKAQILVSRMMKYKFWRIFVLPYDLPWVDQVKISDELLEKIFIEGLDKHQHELILELKSQNAIDHYERFRKVYRPAAFAVGFYFYYKRTQRRIDEKDEGNDENTKQKFMGHMSKLSASLNTEDNKPKSVDFIKAEQLERLITKYKALYQRDPDAQEIAEMRAKVYSE